MPKTSMPPISDDIIRLSNGGAQDKVKAVNEVLANPAKFDHDDVLHFLRRLSSPMEPEIVRLTLAKGIESERITVGIHEALSELSRDSSEVVREQVRISTASADLSFAESDHDVRLLNPKWWVRGWKLLREHTSRAFVQRHKLEFSLILVILIGGVVTYLAYFFGLQLSESALTSLAQVDATIFALAFTIPLAASQFGRYPRTPGSFLDKTNTTYFGIYSLATFSALIAGTYGWMSRVTLGLSVTCAGILLPYLVRTNEKLQPLEIIRDEKRRIVASWKDKTEKGQAEAGLQLENFARIALAAGDYSTLELTLNCMISLLPLAGQLPVRWTYSTLQPGPEGLHQAIQRIGEVCIDDSVALSIWCNEILGLATRKSFIMDEETRVWKYIEYDHLSELAKLSSETRPATTLLLALIEWGILNKLSDPLDEMKRLNYCVIGLSPFSTVKVEDGFRQSRLRIERYFIFSYPAFSRVQPFKASSDARVRMHLHTMLSRLEVGFGETVLKRELGKLNSNASPIVDLAKPEDYMGIILLQRVCYSPEAVMRDDWRIESIVEGRDDLESVMKEWTVLVAKVDSVVVGSVRARQTADQLLIWRLFVHPSFGHKGLGALLLGKVERTFSGVQVAEGYVGVREFPRMAFCQKNGYAESRSFTLSNGVELVYVQKSLGAELSSKASLLQT